MKTYLALLSLIICISSCTDTPFYQKNTIIHNHSWNYSQTPSFPVTVEDKNAKYDLYINIRHNRNYKYSNLYVLLHEKSNNSADTAFRKEIKLAELDGKWVGNNSGELYEVDYLAKKDFSFPDTGTYIFALEQNMRDNPLKEITDVGIKIIKK